MKSSSKMLNCESNF